jgi:hypothetical protein
MGASDMKRENFVRRRMFTRRRHAVAISERCLKLIAWLGAPAMMFFLVLVLVLRLHELTGEWRFL